MHLQNFSTLPIGLQTSACSDEMQSGENLLVAWTFHLQGLTT